MTFVENQETITCDFEEPFICGYNSLGWERTNSLAISNGPVKDTDNSILGKHFTLLVQVIVIHLHGTFKHKMTLTPVHSNVSLVT